MGDAETPAEPDTGSPPRNHVDELLDEAIEDTFPASDPPPGPATVSPGTEP
jgi:hypothetical protein